MSDSLLPLTDRVRASCARVAQAARLVRVRADRVAEYAKTLSLDGLAAPAIDPEHHYLGRGEATVAFLLTLDAINFGSGYFPHLQKRPGLSGYYTVAAAWNDYFNTNGPPTAEGLTRLRAADMAAILGQRVGDSVVGELMDDFAVALGDLGRWLLEGYGGRFVGPVEAAGHSAERLAERLGEMPYFHDVAVYGGFEVAFYKRAQLAASDLALAFGGEGWGRFDDLSRLTIFADNLVPHVLRVDGVLEVDPGLALRIEAEELIPSGSPEEIEIRAAGVHGCELVVGALREQGHAVTAMALDNLLWNRGQAPEYKLGRPRHRTRSVFY